MLLRTFLWMMATALVLGTLVIAPTVEAQQGAYGGRESHPLPPRNNPYWEHPTAQPRQAPPRSYAGAVQPAAQQSAFRPLPASHPSHNPYDNRQYTRPSVVRGQQPQFGGSRPHSLPGEGTYPNRQAMFAGPPHPGQPSGGFAPVNQQPVPHMVGQPVNQPPGYPVQNQPPQPAGSGLGQLWQGHPWAQPVSQPPFVPQSPLVIPDGYADLNVDLRETQTGRFVIGAGINSDAGLVGNIVIDEQNFDLWRWPRNLQEFRNGTAFRGGGQRFRLEALPGTEVQRYSFNFSEPYLFQTSVSFGLSGFYYSRIYTDWDEERKGGRVSLGYIFPQRPDLSTTFQFRYENINISDPSVPSLQDLANVVGSNDLLGFRWQVAHDTRDSTVLPTEGHLIQLSFEQVVGTFDYPKFQGDYRKYFVMSERPDGSGRHILGLSGKFGVSGKNTPIYDRFFAGGFNTIRGFDFRGASPMSASGVIVGGEFQAIGSAEYRFPLTASDQVFGSFFLDVGTVEEVANITASDIRITPGFELRVNIPALGPIPIAVGMGFPVQHEQGDDIRNFHFFVGISR